MPKSTQYRLNWHIERRAYELVENTTGQLLRINPGESDWFDWLDIVSSFTFSGNLGQFTARKESRQWGDGYWYAYRRVGSKLSKKYLGRTTDLTPAHLEEIASSFNNAVVLPSKEVPSEGSIASPPASPDIQHDPLLLTKLHRPRPHSRLVSRSRLIERIQDGMERALMLISAPAGFGKTTLLAQWLSESDLPVAWLSLEPEDNDPIRFLTYLVAALQTIDAHLGAIALDLLRSPQPPTPENVVAVLINDLVRSSAGDFVLILDDYHVITTESLHRALIGLVEHLPPQLHLMIATRADPPLPLSRLRARGQLTELRADDLRFSLEEADVFLHTVMGLDLAPEDVAVLESRTEGWIAGLQLAGLSLQSRTDVSGFLDAFTGSHRFVLDYLSEEVFSRQPVSVQSFLLHTSVLERLNGSLCDAITEQQGSQTMLEAIEQVNLFDIPLDEERHWYRYHHLFAEVLKNRLQQSEPALVPELHHRASIWYEQHNLPIEAVQHALDAQDFERASVLVEQFALSLGLTDHLYTVLGWLKALPNDLVRARPLLCLYYAALLLAVNEVETSEVRLQDAERCVQKGVPPELARIILGHVYSLRSTIILLSGNMAGGVSLARQSLDLLPETEVLARTGTLVMVAHAFLLNGDVTLANQHEVEAAVDIVQTSGNLQAFVRGISLLAWLYMVQGRLRDAAATYVRAAQVGPRPEVLQILVISNLLYYFGLGKLQYELNNLDEAAHYLTLGMDIIKAMPRVEPFVAIIGYTTFAHLQQARGETSEAHATLGALMHMAHEQHFTINWVMQITAALAQFELARGDLHTALRWMDENGLSISDTDLLYPREQEYLALARVSIAQGRKDPSGPFLPDALHLLDHLLQDAESKARMGSALEILILQSLALDVLGKRKEALASLERALTLAAPEGYIRLFVDEGAPMLALLRETSKRAILPNYVATLLAAFGEPISSLAAPHASRTSALVEPLTEREREVLRLLLEGASNREIARRLILSINTVKRHIYNICGKLGVHSRTQAIAKARTLNLL
jgi:LuxR family maltose regulon positive regulatory protein